MTQKTCIHFLIIVVLVLSYFLYEKDKENSRLYKICVDQESVIKIQKQAMQSQAYLKQLELHYRNYYQNDESPMIQ